ncbi:hypothetical protein, partial [Serratia marcescens]|uniref:hypothetical protein n=1 Tax=Serratia marcescens TaxID=615 RepID=UPI001952A143
RRLSSIALAMGSVIKRAAAGAIAAIIRDVAAAPDATFVTSDIVQAEVAEGKGIDVEFLELE